jgi:hypothetical protein
MVRIKQLLANIPYIRFLYRIIFGFFSSNDKYSYGITKYIALHVIRLLLALIRTKIGVYFISVVRGDSYFTERMQLRKNGITVLPNFLSADESNSIRGIIQSNEVGSTPDGGKTFQQDGASYFLVDITGLIEPHKVTYVRELCESYLGHSDVYDLHFWLHGVEDIGGVTGSQDKDINLVWHTDTFHSTVKGFLYLEPLMEEDGPFEYLVGSHVFTWRRLFFEYLSSLKIPSKQGFRAPQPFQIYPRNRPKLFSGLGNALIVADTFGFHRRGGRSVSGKRYSVHFSCRTNPFRLSTSANG